PHLSPGARLLEIGCGAGNLLLQATVRESYPVALDLSMQALTFVRSRLEAALSGTEAPAGYACAQAVGESLPFLSGSFDCVLMSEVIEHLEAPEISVCEAVRVLRPGGRLLITTPNYRSFWPLMEWLVDRLNMAPKMAGEQHISRFHPSSLERLLKEAGLQIEYSGSIYQLSPFLSMISSKQAERQLTHELYRGSSWGMILVAVGIKH
ncbi:MAG: methyltransferase domain-containing protein, partial [Chloroflexota bacterium]|nr:methyltransferase domain-containing protein [Chloroflexota bacterium]